MSYDEMFPEQALASLATQRDARERKAAFQALHSRERALIFPRGKHMTRLSLAAVKRLRRYGKLCPWWTATDQKLIKWECERRKVPKASRKRS